MAESDRSPTSGDGGDLPRPENALALWREKLEFLRAEEAKLSDSAQRFTVQKQIEEVRAKIAELGGTENDPAGPITPREPGWNFAHGTLPPRPELFLGRSDDLRTMKLDLGIGVSGSDRPVPGVAVVRGYPGVGKTSTAIELAYDPEIIRGFPDGILWTSLGQQPHLHASLTEWARALGHEELRCLPGLNDAVRGLRDLLQNRQMLLIVDDVWDVEHAATFRSVAPAGCTLLFTTRETRVADSIVIADESVFNLPVLAADHAVALLERLAPDAVALHPAECRELAVDLECLPLSLHVAGRMLRVESTYDWGVAELLRELRQGTALLNQKAPSDRFDVQNQTLPTVAVLLEQSTNRLDGPTRACFALLGAFAPKPATFNEAAMQAVWEVEDAKPIVRTLVSRGLLEPVGRGRFQMHALLVAHAKSLLGG